MGIEVLVLPKDLSISKSAKEIFDYCQEHKIKVDYLINNAGLGDYGFFIESDWKKQEQMINLNITALTCLTRLFLPGMVERKSGKIMNLASTAAFQPGPTMSVYFASKAFVLHFSEAIANELEGTGVTVTALCPGASGGHGRIQDFQGKEIAHFTGCCRIRIQSNDEGKSRCDIRVHEQANDIGRPFFPEIFSGKNCPLFTG